MCSEQVITTLQALCPIQWIPDEILLEIFFHCLPDDHRFSRTLAPLLMCHVCKFWRKLALSKPGFWTKLSFWTPPTSKRDLLCYPSRLVNPWLSWSRALPLQLIFESGTSLNHLKSFVELVLLEHYPRCQHLELSVSSVSARGLINFIDLPPGSLRMLESLVLNGFDEAPFFSGAGDNEDNDYEDNDDTIIPMTVFKSSPMLRKLATSSLDFIYHLGADEMRFNLDILPWIQLTHLFIGDFINVDVFVHALVECLAIQFLRVSLDLEDEEEDPDYISNAGLPIHVVLPSLTAMYISVDGGSSFPSAMNIFQFPALNAVHFRRCRDGPQVADRFSWTDSAHFCGQLNHLQHLTLTGHVGSTEQVISLLQHASTITTLVLDISVDHTLLVPVLFPADTIPPLPYLTNLELHLEYRELSYPQCPPTDVFEITRAGIALRRIRGIALDSSQPCIFRFREMIESTKPCFLRGIHVFYLRGPPCEKSLRELRKQFRSSALATQFEKKNVSSRFDSDRELVESYCGSTVFSLL